MKPAAFELIRPETLTAALQALHDHRDVDVKIISGGQSLIPMMNFRVALPDILVDLSRVPELNGVEEREQVIAIGAMTRHADVKAHPLVARHLPLVREAYGHVAHAAIRNRGTLGGNLAHADPASEMPTVMRALDAVLVVQGQGGVRTVPAAEFFFGPFTTAIEPGEILVEIQVPKARPSDRFAFEEMSLRKGDFAISAVAVRLAWDAAGCSSAGIAIAGVAAVPVRAEEAEAELVGRALDPAHIAAAAEAATAAIEFTGTATVSAAYRRDLTRTLLVRALTRASSQ